MLDSSTKKTIDTRAATVVGPDTTIQGEVRCRGTLRIEGEVQGRIQSDDTIIVTETGKVKADLLAAQIIIGGEVQGNVFAQERLEITAKGRLIGDLTAPRVSIEEGVIFEGKCSMKAPGSGAASPASPSLPQSSQTGQSQAGQTQAPTSKPPRQQQQ